MSYLADELHVTILNTVVDHLNVVAGTCVTNPVTAWLTVGLGGDVLENVLDVRPGLLVTTGHERWTIASTLLTTRDTSANKSNALLFEVLGAAVGVGVVRVTTINDDVAGVAVWQKLLNEVVDSGTGHDEQHHTAGLLEFGTELLDGVGTNDTLACVKVR